MDTSDETLEDLLPVMTPDGVLDLTPELLAMTGGALVVTRVTHVDLAGADCAAFRAVEIRCGRCMAKLDVFTSELALTEKWTLDVLPEYDEADTVVVSEPAPFRPDGFEGPLVLPAPLSALVRAWPKPCLVLNMPSRTLIWAPDVSFS